MRCELCGIDEMIPFKCRYCEGSFCSIHRLPPNHNCAFLKDFLKQPERDREFLEHIRARAGQPHERIRSALYDMVYLRFSKTEVLHLVIATALVTAVGMSFYGYTFRWDFITIFISAFILHELGHKFLAQFYRAWAEFRVLLYGAVITAFSALPILPFKFIAPGVVCVSGNLSRGRSGRVSWIGPLTNLAMGTGFLVSYLVLASVDSASSILLVGVGFNGWIAFFNLIPFMGLDGQKIFGWNKIVWVLTMAAAIGLFIGGDLLGGGRTIGFLGRFF
ncbi:MAG TPA: AN1-type zinc finger domain-containing protein [Nitrososphaera sp.]|nr:AN1-type zinc finger domain-containing protein [Nitrososphaera sp.]